MFESDCLLSLFVHIIETFSSYPLRREEALTQGLCQNGIFLLAHAQMVQKAGLKSGALLLKCVWHITTYTFLFH